MIDNTAYAAWRVKQSVRYTEKTWARWMAAEQACPVAGAVEFARHVNANGCTMFYITNHDAKSFVPTAANIRKLSFSSVSAKTLLLNSGQSNKQGRFDAVKAYGFDVVVYVGDNLNNLGAATYDKNNQQRCTFVEAFGTKFFMRLIRVMASGFPRWYPIITSNRLKNSLRSTASPSVVEVGEIWF